MKNRRTLDMNALFEHIRNLSSDLSFTEEADFLNRFDVSENVYVQFEELDATITRDEEPVNPKTTTQHVL